MLIFIMVFLLKTIVCSTNWPLLYTDEFDRAKLNSGNITWNQLKAVSVCRSKFHLPGHIYNNYFSIKIILKSI